MVNCTTEDLRVKLNSFYAALTLPISTFTFREADTK